MEPLAHRFIQTGWQVSSRDPLVSTPVAGTRSQVQLLTWVLGI